MSLQRHEKFFVEADTDRSGYLSLEELTAILKKHGYRKSDSEIRAMFVTVDTSGDNKISMEEYLVAMGEIRDKDHLGATMRTCFRSFDKNGDGVIDRAELDEAFREMGRVFSKKDLDQIIEMADKDRSGTLNYEEFIAEVFGK